MHETRYRLYVPAPGVDTHIDAGSAIVGDIRDGMHDVHYERGGASNVRTFEERIIHAAGRRAHRYPTVARSLLPATDLVDVGSVAYDPVLRHWFIEEILDEAALEAWTPGPHVVGGSPAMRAESAGRLYSRLNASGMTGVAMEMAAGMPMADAVAAVAARPGRMR